MSLLPDVSVTRRLIDPTLIQSAKWIGRGEGNKS
jgi:hypothetical protein